MQDESNTRQSQLEREVRRLSSNEQARARTGNKQRRAAPKPNPSFQVIADDCGVYERLRGLAIAQGVHVKHDDDVKKIWTNGPISLD